MEKQMTARFPKRQILQALSILFINSLLVGAGLFSINIYTYESQLIAILIVFFFVFPMTLIQPWSIICFFVSCALLGVPFGFLLTPLLTSLISIPLFIFLDKKGFFRTIEAILSLHLNWKIVPYTAGAFLCILVCIGFSMYIDFPPWNRGVPRELTRIVNDQRLHLKNPKYYTFNQSLYSYERIWKTRISERDLNIIAERYNMRAIPADAVGKKFMHMTPYWWHPEVSDRMKILVTEGFPMDNNSGYGPHLLAVWHPEKKVLYMWIREGAD